MDNIPFLKKLFPLFLVILIFATRIALITGPYFQADGDECVVGLMGKELKEEGRCNIYFWGQRYGFVPFETATAAVAYSLFGENEYSLKISMLFWWAMGCVILYFALLRALGFRAAVLFSLMLVLSPVWGLWSMKARGGYITSFFFSALTAYLMAVLYKSPKKNYHLWFLMGSFLALMWFSQKLWVISLLPFLVLVLLRLRSGRILSSLLMFGAASGVYFLITWLAKNEVGNYLIVNERLDFNIAHNMPKAFAWLQVFFRGSYFLGNVFTAGGINNLIGLFWVFLFVMLLLRQVHRLITGRHHFIGYAACVSALMCLLPMWIEQYETLSFRYLLPAAVPLMLCLSIEISALAQVLQTAVQRAAGLALFAGFCIVSFTGLVQLRNVPIVNTYNTAAESFHKSMNDALAYLKAHGVHDTFCPDAMFLWEVNFYSNAHVLCRSHDGKDRDIHYIGPVTRNFAKGARVAMIGTFNCRELFVPAPPAGVRPENIVSFGRQISVYLDPTRETLEKLGYDLTIYPRYDMGEDKVTGL